MMIDGDNSDDDDDDDDDDANAVRYWRITGTLVSEANDFFPYPHLIREKCRVIML
jgi:hypothetical protein